MTWRACVPDRELWGGFVYPTLALVAARQAVRGKGGDAVSLEREPSQHAHSSSCQLPLSPICFGHAVKRGTSDLLFPSKTNQELPPRGWRETGMVSSGNADRFFFFCTVTEPISTQTVWKEERYFTDMTYKDFCYVFFWCVSAMSLAILLNRIKSSEKYLPWYLFEQFIL